LSGADIVRDQLYMGNNKENGKSCMADKEAVNSTQEAARRAALPEPARRALEEADARKRAEAALPENERGGPKGVEPTRYGDWERKGIAYDF
jgi:hypothetical protein